MAKRRSKVSMAISDRSGFKFPYNEMVVEPGTGYFVHKSESDGEYNLVDHPQNKTYIPISNENQGLYNARPEPKLTTNYLTDESGNLIFATLQFGIIEPIGFDLE